MHSAYADSDSISAFEATSFMNKFKDLWKGNKKASLHFETEAGEAFVTLKVALGPHPCKARHVPPSQHRRRERRAAARAAEEAARATKKTIEENVVEKATETQNSSTVSNSPIHQIDGQHDAANSSNTVVFTFNSDYAEEDLIDTVNEYFPTSILVSRERVRPLSADHVCTIEIQAVGGKLSWPAMKPSDDDVFKNVERIK